MSIEAETTAPHPADGEQADTLMPAGAVSDPAERGDSQDFNAAVPGETPDNIDPADPNALADHNLDFLFDVPVSVTVELGRTRKKIEEVIAISNGTVVEFPGTSQLPQDVQGRQRTSG